MKTVEIRAITEGDLSAVAALHSQVFSRQGHSLTWIECNVRAYPRMRYFVAAVADQICGYVLWTEKSGFRAEVVLELEQIAVLPRYQGQGIGEVLIRASMPMVVNQLSERGATLNTILVTTRADNEAQRLYRKTLGAEIEAVIPGLFSADEVVMVARNLVLPDAYNAIAINSRAG
jgi:ribosomal protein S18 acetylase RimI-like enzyme